MTDTKCSKSMNKPDALLHHSDRGEIARKHLIPHAITKHGLDSKEWAIDDEALLLLIRRYTREAGVRNLERELSTLIRKAVKELTLSKTRSITVEAKTVADYLGVPKYRYGEVEDKDQIGVVTGLAWTDVGGELLTIEAAMMPGKGRMTVTGNLRDVMKESISAAASYVRMRAVAFGIKPPLFDKRDIHVHVPEGATPKDGPSASGLRNRRSCLPPAALAGGPPRVCRHPRQPRQCVSRRSHPARPARKEKTLAH
jgi:ATP-dependent Lon protease